jgi:predicted DNA-binding protein
MVYVSQMQRTQLILDTSQLAQVRRLAKRSRRSISALVRDAIDKYVAAQEPDFSWAASLVPAKKVSHDWKKIEKSIEGAWTQGK